MKNIKIISLFNGLFEDQAKNEEVSRRELNCSNQAIKVLKSKEYGASSLLLAFARNLKLDQIISSQKVQWREYVLAIIVARLLYPTLDSQFPSSCYNDTMLWEGCGHQPNKKLDLNKYYFKPLERLLLNQDSIQRKIFKNEGKNECLVVYDFPFWNQGCNSPLIISFLSNLEGCPLGVEFFDDKNHKAMQRQIENIVERFKVKYLILVGNWDRALRLNSQEIKWINAITDSQIKEIMKAKPAIFESLHQEQYHDLDDPSHAGFRYVICSNKKRNEKLWNGCRILQTTLEKDLFAALDIEKIYRNMDKINRSFSSVISLDSSLHFFNHQIRQIFFLHMLSYYLQWHMEKKLESYFQEKQSQNNVWTLSRVIEKLKTIRYQTIQIDNHFPKELKSTLDSEHREIASIFDVIM